MATTQSILRYARWLEDTSPGLLAEVNLMETGEYYGQRDLLDKIAKLIELFGGSVPPRSWAAVKKYGN